MSFSQREILETIRMVELETLDIRTTTLGINLLDCADADLESACEKVYTKIVHHAADLVKVAESIANDYGVPIVNRRIAVTPIHLDLTGRRLLRRLKTWHWELPSRDQATKAEAGANKRKGRHDPGSGASS